MSSSSVETPIESAPANDTSVFSGNSARPPRWASISNAEDVTPLPFACSAPTWVPPAKTMSNRTARQRRSMRRVRAEPCKALPRAESGFAEQRLLRGGLRAPILRRGINRAAELGRGVPGPARIVEHAAGERDHVGLARRNDLFRRVRFRDQADGHRGHAGCFFDRLRERGRITRRQRDFLLRRYAAGRNIDPVDATLFQLFGEFNGLLDVPAAVDPIGRGDLDADR